MKPYILLKSGDNEYRLKISNASAIALEDDLNCSILDGLNRLAEIRILAKYLYAAMKHLNSGITESGVLDVMDEYCMNGGKTEDLYDIILEVMENSGYITREALDSSKKIQAQMREKMLEKQNALLSI